MAEAKADNEVMPDITVTHNHGDDMRTSVLKKNISSSMLIQDGGDTGAFGSDVRPGSANSSASRFKGGRYVPPAPPSYGSSLSLPSVPDSEDPVDDRQQTFADVAWSAMASSHHGNRRTVFTAIPELIDEILGDSEEEFEFTDEMRKSYHKAKSTTMYLHPYGNHTSEVEHEVFGDDEDHEDEVLVKIPVVNNRNQGVLIVWVVVIGMMAGMAGMIAFMAEIERFTSEGGYTIEPIDM